MPRVRLIHWSAVEASRCAKKLRAAGHTVIHKPLDPTGMKEIAAKPPDAVVVDLSRQPSQGRDVGVWLRGRKATKLVPLVFVEGEASKVKRTKKVLPDATYATWGRIKSALKKALASPPAKPAAPGAMAGYSGTPLPKKLGIKPGSTVGLVGAPQGFEETLGTLPADVTLRTRARGRCDLILWFNRSKKDFERRIEAMAAKVGPGDGMWIAWPKQASGVQTDLTQNDVRRIGLANGLVDYKIAAIDATWSGLKFARRKR